MLRAARRKPRRSPSPRRLRSSREYGAATTDKDGWMLFGDAHVQAYRRTDGAEGYEWKDGSHIILLTTIGHRSGKERTVPLIHGRNGDDYLVVASRGGADDPPSWYVNLEANPTVTVQDRGDVFTAVARTATDDEKRTLWPIMTREWPAYDRYQARTHRQIPVVILERVDH